MTKEELRSALAAYAHETWSGWMKYQFSKCDERIIDLFGKESPVIPAGLFERWSRQMNTPFSDLPEEEKKSDFVEADKILAVFKKYEESIEAKAISKFIQELASKPLQPSIGEQLMPMQKLPDGAIPHYLEFNYAPVSEGQTGASQ